jgi:RND family efflux transporter MFP subunit
VDEQNHRAEGELMTRRIIQVLLPVLLIGLGAAGAKFMVKKRPKAGRKMAKPSAMVVDVVRLVPIDHEITVSGQGTVTPERTVIVLPQVGGVITEESPALQVGGRLRKGDVIVRLDDRDYKLQVALREAEVSRVRFDMRVEKGRRAVAQREWKMLDGSVTSTAEGKKLALRQPHKARVEAALAGAQSALAAAKLSLARTVIRAPFDAVVRDKKASLGQVVGPGAPIATLVQSDRFLVKVSVPLAHLDWIKVPGLNADAGDGADVTISYEAGSGRRAVRTGKVERLLGDLDPAGRMALLTVAVKDPLQVRVSDAGASAGLQPGDAALQRTRTPTLPLLLGGYVRADIRGKRLQNVYRVPSHAVREGNKIWIADAKDRLRVQSLNITWRERDAVLVSSGLTRGDRVVVSRVPSAVPGMALKPRDLGTAGKTREPMAKSDRKKADALPGGPKAGSAAPSSAPPSKAQERPHG